MKLKYWILVPLAALVFVFGFSRKLLSESSVTFASAPSEVLLKPTVTSELPPFDPAYYGLPEVIAGYKILAVKTPENTACMPLGTIGLVLQTSEPDMATALKNTSLGSIENELKKFNLKAEQWNFGFIGPQTTQQEVLSTAKQWDPRIITTCIIW